MSQFFDPTGYNKADAQFHERDEQLLKEMREKLNAKRQAVASTQAKNQHWMKCPKCGGAMKEISMRSVLIDQCGSCGGVYFDAGELEILIGHDPASRGMIERLFSWLPKK
ncbi:MAG: zf-TFIIB domain-containing protein [Phycisphaerae bacterium]|nr:zf-TFIIB domain-containing protein [Phycisphaerae bacterium]